MPEETAAHIHDGVEESIVLRKLNRNPEQLRGAFSDGVSHRRVNAAVQPPAILVRSLAVH